MLRGIRFSPKEGGGAGTVGKPVLPKAPLEKAPGQGPGAKASPGTVSETIPREEPKKQLFEEDEIEDLPPESEMNDVPEDVVDDDICHETPDMDDPDYEVEIGAEIDEVPEDEIKGAPPDSAAGPCHRCPPNLWF